jgi:hypothetical protein
VHRQTLDEGHVVHLAILLGELDDAGVLALARRGEDVCRTRGIQHFGRQVRLAARRRVHRAQLRLGGVEVGDVRPLAVGGGSTLDRRQGDHRPLVVGEPDGGDRLAADDEDDVRLSAVEQKNEAGRLRRPLHLPVRQDGVEIDVAETGATQRRPFIREPLDHAVTGES